MNWMHLLANAIGAKPGFPNTTTSSVDPVAPTVEGYLDQEVMSRSRWRRASSLSIAALAEQRFLGK